MRRARFHSWNPGEIWKPPPAFKAIDYPKLLDGVYNGVINKHKPKIIEGLNMITPGVPLTISKFNLKSAISDALVAPGGHSDGPTLRQTLRSPRVQAPLRPYTALLNAIYTRQPDPKRIWLCFSNIAKTPSSHIDPQVLNDLLQTLRAHSSKDPQGKSYRHIIDDMIAASIPVSCRERALYIKYLSQAGLGQSGTRLKVRNEVMEKFLIWSQFFSTGDTYTLNTLLDAGMRLEIPLLQDFALEKLARTKNSQTLRYMLRSGKFDVAEIMHPRFVSPHLLYSIMSFALKSDTPQSAHEALNQILSQYKNTSILPMSPRQLASANKTIDHLEFISSTLHRSPIRIPSVPNRLLFMVFLNHYIIKRDFKQILSTLVKMADHNCFPTPDALGNILKCFDHPGWDCNNLDTLIHYICDLSLYHDVLTVNLATRLAKLYSVYDERIAAELKEFLLTLVSQRRELIPVNIVN